MLRYRGMKEKKQRAAAETVPPARQAAFSPPRAALPSPVLSSSKPALSSPEAALQLAGTQLASTQLTSGSVQLT